MLAQPRTAFCFRQLLRVGGWSARISTLIVSCNNRTDPHSHRGSCLSIGSRRIRRAPSFGKSLIATPLAFPDRPTMRSIKCAPLPHSRKPLTLLLAGDRAVPGIKSGDHHFFRQSRADLRCVQEGKRERSCLPISESGVSAFRNSVSEDGQSASRAGCRVLFFPRAHSSGCRHPVGPNASSGLVFRELLELPSRIFTGHYYSRLKASLFLDISFYS